MDPDAVELRVLGCLIEKQHTTPDQYPLSLNALRLACNQSTNREPVVDYDEHTVREAAQRLGRRRWSRLASSQSSRTAKYRHLLDETLVIGKDELALLCVLLLRGAQTPGELKARTERLYRFADLDELHFVLGKLIDKRHVMRLERRPGQKEERYLQLLGGALDDDVPGNAASGVTWDQQAEPVAAAPAANWGTPDADAGPGHEQRPPTTAPVPGPVAPGSAEPAPDTGRLDALEDQVRALRGELATVRAELQALRDDLGA